MKEIVVDLPSGAWTRKDNGIKSFETPKVCHLKCVPCQNDTTNYELV